MITAYTSQVTRILSCVIGSRNVALNMCSFGMNAKYSPLEAFKSKVFELGIHRMGIVSCVALTKALKS